MTDNLSALALLVSVLAACRLVRLVVEDSFPPVKALRDRIVERHSTEALVFGPDDRPLGSTKKLDSWAELVTCPWCAGFWVCAVVVAAHLLIWSWWRPAALVFAFSMVVGLIESKVDTE